MTSSAPPQSDVLNGQHYPPPGNDEALYQPPYSAPPGSQGFPAYPPFHVKRESSPNPNGHTNNNSNGQYSDFPLYPPPPEGQKVHGLFENDFGAPSSSVSASINPAELMNQSPHQVDPQLQHSPNPQQQQQQQEYIPSSGFEWDTVMAATNAAWSHHRRAPSEYSDISSAAASPYLGNQEFGEQPSPLLQGQQQHPHGSMQDLLNSGNDVAFGLESFTLQDTDHHHHSRSVSPAPPSIHSAHHSAGNSPFLMPQNDHLLNLVTGNMPPPPMDLHAPPPPPPQLESMVSRAEEAPQINVILAPPQRQPTFPKGMTIDDNGLSPPPKVRRQRSKSDPYAAGSVHPPNPSSRHLSLTPEHASPLSRSRRNSLSPTDIPTGGASNRTPSPDRISKPQHHHHGHSRRSSTNSVPHRDYILELAHPNRPGAASSSEPNNPHGHPKRTQKHPANFQCTLCPKRFTRAYNLRSHLRTHTDERPFVCTVCGKAFARQHDRKRHEGLHSGEKKFVCKGPLKGGWTWGCGRRFARADALGRHFRSEAGRVCIKPLLDEETAERAARGVAGMDQNMFGHPQHQGGAVLPSQQLPGNNGLSSMNPNLHAQQQLHSSYPQQQQQQQMNEVMAFPSALLAQYPALATVNWNMLGPEDDGDMGDPGDVGIYAARSGDESVSGRSSFDASAGEYESYDERGWGSDVGEGDGR